MRRRSSPGWYARCCAKSVDEPFRIERCWPCMKPSTTVLASSARSESRARSTGSRKEAGAVGTSDRCARGGQGGDQLGDQRLRRHLLGLRLEVEQDAMAQHGQREGTHVVERDVGAPLEQRARLAPEDERL